MAEPTGLSETDKQALAEIGRWADRMISNSAGATSGFGTPEPPGRAEAGLRPAAAWTAGVSASDITGSSGGSTAPNLPSVSSLVSSLAPQSSSVEGWLGKLVSPVIGGLLSLFRGASETPDDTFVPFEMPASLNWNLGVRTGPGVPPSLVDRDGEGNIRQAGSAPAPVSQPITIQVQTLDSRSFQDHSKEIADAVRRALLESHDLNDTLRGLDQ